MFDFETTGLERYNCEEKVSSTAEQKPKKKKD
jgi:hypothetical protein